MTDMRRTLLWVVFVMSLVLLWDAWNRHNGTPSMFGVPTRPQTAASAPPVPGSSAAGAGTVPSATGSAPSATVATTPPATSAAGAPVGEVITLTTDLVKALVDTRGGELVHLELLQQHDQFDRT